MAASLGLNPESLFSSAYAYSSPFLANHYAPPAGDGDICAQSFNLHDDHQQHYPRFDDQFENSPPTAPPPITFTGAREDEHRSSDKTMEERMSAGRIGFRTRSEAVEILDDGFKWRKYGKKAVKNSANPRNYYRCSSEGCGVKKRVQRDQEDPRYVVTTYDGVHNHATPGTAVAEYYCYSPARRSSGSPPAAYAAAGPLYF
ncbi:probable WRKY transcription factor 50 [Lolium rigidum]|uniref:probable WRKY transcription factor 50 n=1 Tax=Lolium rigidum TaxID=89674 RepID=UPI001F5D6A82|nr:probable WRKY transcription factor 50 [Lolium rigidum]